MDNCIFCKIVKGEIPSFKIYEDENFLAFMDVFPRAKGHALVIPKQHYRWVYDVANFGEYWEVSKAVAVKIQKSLNAEFISFLTMGEEVPHAHIHILPNGEGLKFGEVKSISKEEIKEMAKQILNTKN
jgi:histidine triad (HIT) family protein